MMAELRTDRDELPTFELRPDERQERDVRRDIAERSRTKSSVPPQPCSRQRELMGEWIHCNAKVVGRALSGPGQTAEEKADDRANIDEAWILHTMLRKHAANCPVCVVFPAPAPYMKEPEASERNQLS
jgi:hypothetical protein